MTQQEQSVEYERVHVQRIQGRFLLHATVIAAWLSVSSVWLWTMWSIHNPFPFADDFNSCLSFLVDWLETRDVRLVLATYNEAPNLLLRVAVLTSYYAFGEVSFSFLILVASCAPLLFALTLARWVSTRLVIPLPSGMCLTLPTLMLMAQPATWGSYGWSSSAYVHAFLPLMALLSFMALDRGNLVWGLVIALLSAFFGGAGVFLTVLAFVYATCRLRRKGLVVAIVCVVALGLIGRMVSIVENPVLRQNLETFVAGRDRAQGIVLYALAFVGNAFNFSGAHVAAALGAAVLQVALMLRPFRSMPLAAVIILAIAAGVSSAILRFPAGGLPHALLSRYQVYSTAAWSAVYGLMIVRWERQRGLLCAMALLGIALFAGKTYSSIPKVAEQHNVKMARELVVARFDPAIVLAEFPPRSATDHVFQRAQAHKVFNPDPTSFFISRLEKDVPIPEKSADLKLDVSLFKQDDRFAFVRGSVAIQAAQTMPAQAVCIIALSKKSTASNIRLCLPAVRGRDLRSDAGIDITKDEAAKSTQFALLLPLQAIPWAEYDLSIMVRGRRDWHLKALSRDFSK
jgi:hypothetical protein